MKIISFTKVRLPYGWMGSMAPYPVVDSRGLRWRTTEHLFQAMRFAPDDKYGMRIRQTILDEKSPMGAKFMARKNTEFMVAPPRSELDVANMREVLHLKITQHPDLVPQLTATGSALIIEDETNRQHRSPLFWGAALRDGVWVGDNMLGKLWMELRQLVS